MPFSAAMFIIHVYLHVKEDCIDRFKEITLDNARNTVQEPGAIRFDVFQNQPFLVPLNLKKTAIHPFSEH